MPDRRTFKKWEIKTIWGWSLPDRYQKLWFAIVIFYHQNMVVVHIKIFCCSFLNRQRCDVSPAHSRLEASRKINTNKSFNM